MLRRLYFILPDAPSTRKVHDALLLARVDERHMHVIARDDVDLSDLPDANLLQKSDLVHGVQSGLFIGGFIGAGLGGLAGVFGYLVPGLQGMAILGTALSGSLIGAFASSMIAINIPNTRHKAFQEDINAGKLLLLVEVPARRVDEIIERVSRHHPEAHVHGVEPTIPAFP